MAALRNNDNSLSSGEGNGEKAAAHQCPGWLKNIREYRDMFRKHAESMARFRQSHGAYLSADALVGVRAPLSPVNTTAKKTGDKLGSPIINVLILQCPENKAARYKFSAN